MRRVFTPLGFLLLLLPCLIIAPPAQADSVLPGPLYLSVGAGPLFLPSLNVIVSVLGVPISGQPPGTSLVINFTSGGMTPVTVPIEIVALSLQSTAPIQVGPSFFDVFVTLEPTHAIASTGTMTVNSNGTFDSFFDVFVQLTLVPTQGGSTTIQTEIVPLQLQGTWSTAPQSSDITRYSGLLTGTSAGSPRGGLPVTTVPEPGTLLFLGTGLSAMMARRLRKLT